MTATKRIDESTLSILSTAIVDGNMVMLNCGQLDRKQYKAVNDVLENIGGKWNRKHKGHVFNEDPVECLEAVLLAGEITMPRKYGYFPTPPEIALQVIQYADIDTGMLVLEPSAGQGGIADHVPKSCMIHCVELLEKNADILTGKGYTVAQCDFMDMEAKPLYDRVVMNPPFERQQDIDHVLHAWDFLTPGGKLVAIMSAGVLFRENRKTVAFREIAEDHGYIERLPSAAFKESGTMVETVIVTMAK